MGEEKILGSSYAELRVEKEDGTVVAKITNESVIPADGYTVHLVPGRSWSLKSYPRKRESPTGTTS